MYKTYACSNLARKGHVGMSSQINTFIFYMIKRRFK